MKLSLVILDSLLALSLATAVSTAGGWTIETVEYPGYYQVFGPSMALDPDGIPHVAYWVPTEGFRYASRDGSPWNLTTIPIASPFSMAPASVQLINTWYSSLAIDGEGVPRIANGNSNYDSYQIVYRTRDSLGWAASSPGTPYGGFPTLALGPTGEPRIVALQKGSSQLEYLEQDSGVWSVTPLPYVSYGSVPLAIGSDGNPHIGYASAGVLSHLWREGGVWHAEVVDSGGVGLGGVAVGADGTVRMAYPGATGALTYAERDPQGWSHIGVDITGDVVQSVTIALDRHDQPRVAFFDATLRRLRYAWTNGGAWTFDTVDTSGDQLSLALSPDGTPHMSYTDVRLFRLFYARGVGTTNVQPATPAPNERCVLAPNPMRVGGALSVSVRLANPDRVEVELFDLAGRRVASRAPESFDAGLTTRAWDPHLTHAGVYLARWRGAAGLTGTDRIVVLR